MLLDTSDNILRPRLGAKITLELYMGDKEPNSLQMLIGLATLGWLGYAWDAYMQMDVYGAVLAIFAGVTFVYLARLDVVEKTMPWLFGWNEAQHETYLLRYPAIASLFVGPATKHLAQFFAPEFFAGQKAYIAVMVVSWIVGFVAFFFIASSSKNES
jgi:hypothetical protein